MTPLPAAKALDAFFFDARCRLLDIAATLDRIDRGAGAGEIDADPRMARIQKALDAIRERTGDRAEAVQQIFSLEYDPNWKRPEPR